MPPSQVSPDVDGTYSRYTPPDDNAASALHAQQQQHINKPAFSFVYKQSGVHYFKHAIVEELDSGIGDIKSEIADRQRYLLLQLEDVLLGAEEQLQQLCIAISTLDALISLGALAVEQNLTPPEMTAECGVLIKNGRHLLQELTVDNFVPNDTFLSSEKNVALITGPNTSGKSVYMKQVALIVYLAHIGSFVPCERARIGLTDRILTRISSTETVSAPQSAFALDLQQVSRMLRSHTRRSLCIIDEFGKGTSPVDGIALLAATVKHFAAHGGLAMFALHFTEILHDQVISKQLLDTSISCFRMEVHEPNAADGGAGAGAGGGAAFVGADEDFDAGWEERTPLFKLKKGVAGSSEGIPCAHSAGVPDKILRRALEVKSCVLQRRPVQPSSARANSLLQNPQHVQLLSTFLGTQNWVGEEGALKLPRFQEML